ncbi:hypothetical protein DV735_g4924, partial [Chaetothyriales sp. CBS 134920]
MKPHIALPDCGKGFAWDLVTVVDPRAFDRTLQVYLLTRKVLIAIPKHVSRPEGTACYKQVLVSPVCPYTKGDDTGPRQHITFAVVDSRYLPQMVDMFLTPRQAGLLQHSILPSDKASPVLSAKNQQLRFKCYVPGCKATSSDRTFLAAHFQNGIHPGLEFDQERVLAFQVNGEEDPAILKTPSPFIVLPTANNKALKTDESAVKITRLVDDYLAKHPVTAEVEAESDELFCTCLSRDDGRVMLKCSNDNCRLLQYHLECLGLTGDDLPSPSVPWFCPECIKEAKAGKRPARSAYSPSIPSPEKIVPPQSGKPKGSKPSEQVAEGSAGPSQTIRKQLAGPLSPSVDTNPWSAGIVTSFANRPEAEKDYDLTSLASAKAALQARHAQPLGKPVARPSRPGEEGYEYSAASYKSPNRLSWTAAEEQHLKDVVKECADAGLSGEALWVAAHPKLVARGVNRPIGGMKMRWCRGLRDQTKIDERRKPNNKLLTALQKPKSGRPFTSLAKKARAQGAHPLKTVLEASAAGEAPGPSNVSPTSDTSASANAPASNAGSSSETAGVTGTGEPSPALASTSPSLLDQHRVMAPRSANYPVVPGDLTSWGVNKPKKPTRRTRSL